MKKKLSEQDKAYNKRLRKNKKLFKKALKDTFKVKPAPGLKYLKNVTAGQLVKCSNSKAILVNCNDTSCVVIVTSSNSKENEQYNLGRHRWAPLTEVEVLG